MHYLRISILVDTVLDLDAVRDAITADLDNSLDGVCKVVNITHDRDLAKAFTLEQSSRTEHQVLTRSSEPLLSNDVAAVLGYYKLTLPKSWMKKGAPPVRVPPTPLWGAIEGLPTMRGKIVLTNGIMAFMVREDGKWDHVNWDHFIPDSPDLIPSDLPIVKKVKKDTKIEEFFAEF